ncbi:MAG TPA: T9SS type A sorting domain-containing protein [Bacteroidetes bacterium]|nr:T9SS type A sorting domain-containing protein [Bacteroidota bacterium]
MKTLSSSDGRNTMHSTSKKLAVNFVFGEGLAASIIAVNLSGQVIFEESFHESTSIDTNSWPKGVYIIEVTTAEKKHAEKLLVK